MIVTATVNPDKDNGLAQPRKVSIDYNLGNTVQQAIQLHGEKAVFANFVKGAKLPLQQEERSLGDVQTYPENDPEGRAGQKYFLTDEQISERMNTFKLPEKFIEPKSDEDVADEVFAKLTPAQRDAYLRKYKAGQQAA